jgi:hypothetical protein
MYHFIKITHPVHDGAVVPHVDVHNNHDFLKNWLIQNYPNFDVTSFDAARARQNEYFDLTNKQTPPIWAYMDGNTDFYGSCVFWNVAGTPNNHDAEFRTYVDAFLHNPGWDTPGSIEEIVYNSVEDIPHEWFVSGVLDI